MPLLGRKKVNDAITKLTKDSNNKLKAVYLWGLGRIITETPADTGRARNNWFASVGLPSGSTTTLTGTSQLPTLPENVLGKKIYLTNNLPYIGMLEYGGYPKPVKKGTLNKLTKTFEIRSVAGFSKQVAPKGWVRVIMIRMQNEIRKGNE